MERSDQADSELAIRLEAETGSATQGVESAARDIEGSLHGVTRAAEEAGNTAAGAMEKTAREARKAGEEVKKVGEHAKLSAGQIRALAVGMAGMALNAYGAWADNHGGRSAGAAYTQSAIAGAAQGAATGAIGGHAGMAAGAVIGAGTAAFATYEQREAAEKAEAKAREDSIKAMREQIAQYETLRARTETFQKTLAALGNEETSAALREESRAAEIARREAEDARLAQAQRDAADRNDADSFRALSRDRNLNAQELAALKVAVVSETPSSGQFADRLGAGATDAWQKRGMDLFGAVARSVDSPQVQLQREANAIARQQLDAQKSFIDALRRTSARLSTWN